MPLNNLSEKEISKYREELTIFIQKSGNKSLSKNEDKILSAFGYISDVLRLTKDEFGQIVLKKAIEIVEILVDELNLGTKTVISALFYSIKGFGMLDDIDIQKQYQDKVSDLVQTLMRIPIRLSDNPKNKAEDLRNLLLTISYDLRVTFIILARKLQEVRFLCKKESNLLTKKFAAEVLDVFAPLAHRIGLYDVKTELEDWSFKLFQPDIYNYIANRLEGTEQKRMIDINKFCVPIMAALDDQGIKYDIDGRIKSIYSIWNKMQKKHVSFDEIYDIYAIRIIFDPISELSEITQCWNIFSLVTDIYSPKLERIRNWISKPKENGYEALHVTVKGGDNKWVEVQIRSRRMDEFATLGMAAHWKYKGYSSQETPFDKLVKKLQGLKEFSSENPYEILDNFKSSILYPDIYVFTPKNEIIKLKSDSTVLDFAFQIHTDLGLHCIGAKVNHQTVAPEHILKSGDRIQILSSKTQQPKSEWLDIVKTERAKEHLRLSFKKERKAHILRGYRRLERITTELNIFFDNYIYRKLARVYQVGTKDQLYYKLDTAGISDEEIINILKERSKEKKINFWKILCSDEDCPIQENIEIAQCCLPLPGQEIIGLKSKDEIIAHKKSCSIALSVFENHPTKRRRIKWKSQKLKASLTTIIFSGIDKMGIVNQITAIIANELHINMRSIQFESDQRNFNGKIEIYYPQIYNLNNLISKLINIKGMKKVDRI